jgi:hypothetical protein
LVAAAVTYYLWRVFADGTISLGFLLTVGVFWLLMAVVAGAIAGWFGARSHRSEHLWGIPVGVFVGEAVAVALRSARGSQIAVEVGLAVVCLVAARGSFKRASWLALFTALPVGLVSLVYRSWLA